MRDTKFMELFEKSAERGPVSLQEQLSVLRGLGLEISDEAAKGLPPEDDYENTFEKLGWGEYDYDTKDWKPSSHQFYSFDGEVCDLETMYLTFFQGLQSITEGELTITDVYQDNSQANWEEPSGTITVTFHLNGEACRCDVECFGDWLDARIRHAINDILERMGIEKRFFAIGVGQGECIFFCTRAWARELEDATLCYVEE